MLQGKGRQAKGLEQAISTDKENKLSIPESAVGRLIRGDAVNTMIDARFQVDS
jgi:histone H3/H4